jgi:cytoskeletal protein CcmA (bactofilin family)
MKKSSPVSTNTSLIAKGMQFHGDLHFAGVLEIEGEVFGSIVALDEAVAEVRIRETGYVQGVIYAPVIIVNGKVDGDIYCSNHMELAAKGKVVGNVYYHLLEMVLGCAVEGQLSHRASAELTQHLKKQVRKTSASADLDATLDNSAHL